MINDVMGSKLFLRCFALALMAAGCAPVKDSKVVAGNSPDISGKLKPEIQSIQTDFVNTKCMNCHSNATERNRFVDLRDISQIIEGSSHSHQPGETRRNLIKPGCPQQSFFLSIMKESKMPPSTADRINEESLKIIEDWIIGLKPNAGNICNDDEPPD